MQLDDWVRNYAGATIVSEINDEGVVIYDDIKVTPVEYLLPLKLTADILRKNGFVYHPQEVEDGELMAEYYSLEQDGADIILMDRWHGWRIMARWSDNGAGELETYLHGNTHELQHALRLMGLKELADTFKV